MSIEKSKHHLKALTDGLEQLFPGHYLVAGGAVVDFDQASDIDVFVWGDVPEPVLKEFSLPGEDRTVSDSAYAWARTLANFELPIIGGRMGSHDERYRNGLHVVYTGEYVANPAGPNKAVQFIYVSALGNAAAVLNSFDIGIHAIGIDAQQTYLGRRWQRVVSGEPLEINMNTVNNYSSVFNTLKRVHKLSQRYNMLVREADFDRLMELARKEIRLVSSDGKSDPLPF